MLFSLADDWLTSRGVTGRRTSILCLFPLNTSCNLKSVRFFPSKAVTWNIPLAWHKAARNTPRQKYGEAYQSDLLMHRTRFGVIYHLLLKQVLRSDMTGTLSHLLHLLAHAIRSWPDSMLHSYPSYTLEKVVRTT